MSYNEELLRKLLPKTLKNIRVRDETDSTSSEARRYALTGGTAPALFIADSQSGGRGRVGRSFYSPSGTGIYMSLLLPMADSLADTLLMTSASAVAVRRAILRITGADVGIKWVNDLYLGDKKVCGILCELLSEKKMMIVGVGINLYPSSFPEEISATAGSLLASGGDDDLRHALAAGVAEELLAISTELSDGRFMEEYKAHSTILGRELTYTENGVSRKGTAIDVDSRGRLYVLAPDGQTNILSSGEISVRLDSYRKE